MPLGLVIAFFAGIAAAMANLCMRRSLDRGGSINRYLLIQVSFSCLVGIILNPCRTGYWGIGLPTLILGIAGGVLLGAMLWSMGRALRIGPPGLTFAMVNSATVFPSLVMAAIVGTSCGYDYCLWHGMGSILVVIGLFWAGWEVRVNRTKGSWIRFAALAFGLHVLLLLVLQYRALLMRLSDKEPLLFRLTEEMSQWFMPIVLCVAALFQLPGHFKKINQLPTHHEWTCALLGSLASGLSSSCLVWAPEWSSAWENPMIFPAFAVTVIIFSHAWGQVLYRERVNWWACAISLVGLILGTSFWAF